jgi:hypothetical protein
MSHTPGAARGLRDAGNIEEHHIRSPHGEEIEGTADRGRRWYHPGRSPADARTSWDSTPHGGRQLFGSSLLP